MHYNQKIFSENYFSQVKKAGGAAPSSGQGAAANGGGGGSETINLPGMPTIGPPPLSYGGEDNTTADMAIISNTFHVQDRAE